MTMFSKNSMFRTLLILSLMLNLVSGYVVCNRLRCRIGLAHALRELVSKAGSAYAYGKNRFRYADARLNYFASSDDCGSLSWLFASNLGRESFVATRDLLPACENMQPDGVPYAKDVEYSYTLSSRNLFVSWQYDSSWCCSNVIFQYNGSPCHIDIVGAGNRRLQANTPSLYMDFDRLLHAADGCGDEADVTEKN